jgi:hypothetical protein
MPHVILFNLEQSGEDEDELWIAIKSGIRTSEWRVATGFWVNKLCKVNAPVLELKRTRDLTRMLKVDTAWFVIGYSKANLPRLEAEIVGLFYHARTNQLEIKFKNAREVLRP